MKKSNKALTLHRETLHRLGHAALSQPVGGYFPKKDIPVSAGATECACTFTCAGCNSN